MMGYDIHTADDKWPVYMRELGEKKAGKKKLTYDELCESVLEAMQVMERCHATPSEIIMSPEAFNTICDGSLNKPTMFGLKVSVDDGRNGVFRVR